MGVKLIFCLQLNAKIFYNLIVSLWVCLARHAQSTQTNKFAIFLWYLKENEKDKLVVLPADKPQSFLQISIIILAVCGQACANYPK